MGKLADQWCGNAIKWIKKLSIQINQFAVLLSVII